jgi:hypothetical protein
LRQVNALRLRDVTDRAGDGRNEDIGWKFGSGLCKLAARDEERARLVLASPDERPSHRPGEEIE